jgi:hypothetical protein
VSGGGPDKQPDSKDRWGDLAEAAAGASDEDRVSAAVAELYGMAPEDFTGRRGELAVAARGAGDRAAAKAIGALRKPTRAAWVVNGLARADPSAPSKLAEVGAALRAAQEARHGPRLRELSAARGALVDALTDEALRVAGVPDPPPSLRLEVSETLTAALADPEVAAAFATGTLTRAMQWSGFGVLPAAADADSVADEPSAKRPPAQESTVASTVAGDATRSDTEVAKPRLRAARPGRGEAEAAVARQLAEDERLAREAAERAARRREQYEEAERLVVAASDAAAAALSQEDRLEAEVRGLEQRLTQARAELAAARMRARHAEAAERRARQALDRFSG